uniref:Erythritol/L-threitol dehydrogenase n=1 Tax=Ditylenchus dipsaci TaxID=166011 RepID=A0A915CYB0_9BILA
MSLSTKTMEAIVCFGPKDYRFEKSIHRPVAGLNELVIKITACGICTSDCKCWQGAKMFWGDEPSGTPVFVKPPVVPGHEFFGTVVEIGEGAAEHFSDTPIKLGERIIAENIVPCTRCLYCRSGKYWMCEVHHIFGNSNCPPNPEEISLEDSAIIEPLSCAIHAVQRGDIQLDDLVVIAGAGPLGLFMTQVARLKTPKKLVVIDLMEERLELARKFGADVTINLSNGVNAVELVKQLTNGYGCDVYIETTGAPGGVVQGLNMIRKLGRFVEFSVFGSDTTVDWSIIGDRKELDLRGVHLAPYCYPIAIDLLKRGLVTSKGIVTHTYPLSEWDEAIAMACSMKSIKVLMKPNHK